MSLRLTRLLTLFVYIAVIPASHGAEEEGVVLDPQTGNYIVTYTSGYSGQLENVVFVPSTKIEPRLKSEFARDGTVVYQHRLGNGPDSEQNIDMLLLTTVSNINAGGQLSPPSWDGAVATDTESSNLRIAWIFQGDDVLDGLAPGADVSGLALESDDLPGIAIMQITGAAPATQWLSHYPPDDVGDQVDEIKKNNFVPLYAAVPTITVPDPFDAAAILNDIQNHAQALVDLELIEPVFAGQLDELFTAARDALGLDDIPSALSHLKELQRLITEEAGDDNEEWDSQETASLQLLINQLAARVLLFDVGFVIGQFDTDGDGIPDDQDACPASDTTPTIIIDGCDSGVTNLFPEEGCTISDEIAECAEGAKNHGKFVSCVAKLTNDLKKDGIITGQQKGAIQSCAAQAAIP